MRNILICAALAAAVSAPAMAAPSAIDASRDASTQEASKTSAKGRVLYVCDSSDITRRTFVREHGAMEFVTAEAAAQSQEAWAAPRCISRTEYSRLQQMVSQLGR